MNGQGDYVPEDLQRVRSACLYLATKPGDLSDQIVIVGGLAPSLLILPDTEADVEPHVGTTDLDLGLAVGLLETSRYAELGRRLREARFEPDRNEAGNMTRQRWAATLGDNTKVTVDLLIDGPADQGGNLQDLEADMAAVITPGLGLAFRDRVSVRLGGLTLLGEQASRAIWVVGPAAYTILKLLAFGNRGADGSPDSYTDTVTTRCRPM